MRLDDLDRDQYLDMRPHAEVRFGICRRFRAWLKNTAGAAGGNRVQGLLWGSGARSPRGVMRLVRTLAILVLMWIGSTQAAWAACPSTLTAHVASGGVVEITCSDVGFAGFSSKISEPQHGTIDIDGGPSGNPFAMTYRNNGDGATSDSFVVGDDQNNPVHVTVTIDPASGVCSSPQSATIPGGGTAKFSCDAVGFQDAVVEPHSGHIVKFGNPNNLAELWYVNDDPSATSDTFTMLDSSGSRNVVFNITIVPSGQPLTISTTSIAGMAYNLPYVGAQIQASGGTGAYHFSMSNAPPGITISPSGGAISGTPEKTGTFNIKVDVTDSASTPSAATRTYVLTINPPIFSISPAALNDGTINQVYHQSAGFSASNGVAPYTFTVDDVAHLPPGLTLSDNQLTGTPTQIGNFTFTVRATDANGESSTRSYTFNVTAGAPSAPTITGVTADTGADGTKGTASVSFSPSADNGGSPPVTYTVTSTPDNGAPVAGATGSPVIIGNLTRGIAYSFVVTATNASGKTAQSAPSGQVTPRINDTVTVQDPGTLTFGTSTTLVATSLSHTAITFATSTPQVCLITSSGTVTLLQAGTCSVTATTAGNAAYVSGSGTRDITIAAVKPGAPQNVQATTSVAPEGQANGTATVSFSAPASNGGGAITRYGVTSSGGQTAQGTGSPITVTGLTFGTAYTFKVTAENSAGVGPESGNSNAVTPTQAQTITFNNPGTQNFGTTPTLTATSTSGLPVTFTSQTTSVCTITAGGQLTALAPGTCSIRATQAGSSAFTAASPVTQSFFVAVPGGLVSITTSTLPAPTFGVAYSQTITVSGGAPGYHFSLVGALPAGISFSNGVLSGTPTASGTYSFDVTVTDQATQTASQHYTFTVITEKPGAPQIAGISSPFAAPGVSTGAATVTFTPPPSDGGSPITSYVVTTDSGGFSATGNGSPITVTGLTLGTAYRFTVHAVNANGAGPDSIQSSAITPVGNQTITFNNPGSKNFGETASLVATATSGLGVTLTSQTANICRMVSSSEVQGIAPGTCTIRATQSGNAAYKAATAVDQTFSILVPGGAVTITTPSIPAPTRGVFYTQTITAAGGAQPYTFTSSGALPNGLTFNNGTLSGIPTQGGSYSIQVTATDQATQSDTRNYRFTVIVPPLTFTPGTLPAGKVGTAYPATTIAAAAGIAPYTYAVTSGALPVGLALSPNGVLSGTPTRAGSYSVTVTATDNFGETGTQDYTITIGEGVPVALNDIADVAANGTVTIAVTSNDTGGGPITSIAIGQAPEHGSVTVSGLNAVYTPTHDFYGSDSFTYSAMGPGGTSNAATVNVAVARPAAPVASDVADVAIHYGSNGKAIDVGSAISGGHTSIAVASAPVHGTTSIAGDVITYTPTAGYYGPDSFTYTATGLGGTSNAARVSVTVATPAIPVVTNKPGVAVPYGSSGTAIDLSSAISGVHNSVAVGSPPAHGSVTINGDIATYVPAAGYYGADSFTFTATGPGGTSTPATVGLTVATPPVPVVANKSGVAIAYDSPGTAIDLSGSVSGVYSSIAIGSMPTHGSVTIAGTTATYSPTKGYFGADSFTFTATGPGGTSSAATVSVAVATPPAPVVKSGSATVASSTQTQKSVDINLSALVSGEYTSVELVSSPAHGTATIHGAMGALSASAIGSPTVIATYTPASGFAGTDTFSFVAVGPGGRSAPAAITVTVTGTVPTAAAKTAKAIDNQTVSIELTDGATEGPFTGAAVVSVSPADKATTKIVEGGGATARTYRLDVTPAPHFGGTIVVTYTLSNQFGTSAPATVTIAVTARPDPSLDPNVRALSDAQAESTRRFAQAQSRNFLQRAEQLHHGGGSGKARMGISLGLTDMTRAGSPGYQMGQREEQDIADRSRNGSIGADDQTEAAGKSSFSGGHSRGDGERRTGSVAIWSGGQIEIGTRDQTTDRDKISMTSGGLSAGADLKLSDAATVGIGGGVGFDSSKIGGQAASLSGDSTVVAAYGSVAPAKDIFVDLVIGYGDLSFRSRRAVNGATASGSRDGSMWFGAASAGIDRIDGDLRWSLYGRGEWLDGKLGAYSETGADIMDLRFDERDVSSLTGVLGGRIELNEKLTIGSFRPRVRVEWSHEFQDSSVQMLDYADIPGNALYGIRTEGWNRNQYEVAFGGGLTTLSRWVVDIEMGLRGASGERDGRLTVKMSKEF